MMQQTKKLVSNIAIAKYRYDLFLKELPFFKKACVLRKKNESHKRTYTSVEIGLTYDCQLQCHHCGVYGQKKKHRTELNTGEWKKILQDLGQRGVYFVVFAGAEPLLRGDLIDLVCFAVKQNMSVALSTNGHLLSKDTARALKQSRVSFLNVSLDSAEKRVHNTNRNADYSWDKVHQALENLRREKVQFIISTYATRENVLSGDIKRVIDLAKKERAKGVRILPAVPSGKWIEQTQLTLDGEALRIIREYLDPSFVFIEGICNVFTECNAVLKKLFFISPYGDVQPCSFVPYVIGNVRDEIIDGILIRMENDALISTCDWRDCIMRQDIFREKINKTIVSKEEHEDSICC